MGERGVSAAAAPTELEGKCDLRVYVSIKCT